MLPWNLRAGPMNLRAGPTGKGDALRTAAGTDAPRERLRAGLTGADGALHTTVEKTAPRDAKEEALAIGLHVVTERALAATASGATRRTPARSVVRGASRLSTDRSVLRGAPRRTPAQSIGRGAPRRTSYRGASAGPSTLRQGRRTVTAHGGAQTGTPATSRDTPVGRVQVEWPSHVLSRMPVLRRVLSGSASVF